MIYYITSLPNENYIAKEMRGKFKTRGKHDVKFYEIKEDFLAECERLNIKYNGK